MRKLAALALGLLISGCNEAAFPLIHQARQQERAQKAAADWEAASARCNASYPKAVGSYGQRAQCFEAPYRELMRARGGFDDLTNVVVAARAQVAAQIDEGRISEADGLMRMAEVEAGANDRAIRRRSEAAAALPPPPYLQPMPAWQPPPTVRTAPNSITCTSSFGTSHCRTY